jgi:membrane protein
MFATKAKAKIADYIWSYNPCEPGPQHSYWHHFLQIMAMVVRDLMGGILSLRSMSLVYTTLLAFIPLLAVSMWVLKKLGVHEQIQPGLASLLAPLGDRSADFSFIVVEFVENMEIGLLGFLGLSMLVYTSISLMRKIESAFNHTWRVRYKRNWLQRIIIYVVLLAVGPALVFSALAVTASLANHSMLAAISEFPYLGILVGTFGKFLPYILVVGAFTLTYLAVPNIRVNLLSAFYGGLLAGIIWQGTGTIFTAFVAGSTSYTVIYSGLAILMLLMVWVYLSWLILLIGASVAYYHQHSESLNRRSLNMHMNVQARELLTLQLLLNIAYYLPAVSISDMRIVDIISSFRAAEVAGPGRRSGCNELASKLQKEIEIDNESILGELTLAQLLAQQVEGNSDENSLV